MDSGPRCASLNIWASSTRQALRGWPIVVALHQAGVLAEYWRVGAMPTCPNPFDVLAGNATSVTAWFDQRAKQISFADDEQLFGGFESDRELGYAVQHVFGNSGGRVYVTRAPRPESAYGQVGFANPTVDSSKASLANDRILVDIDYEDVDQSTVTGDLGRFNLTSGRNSATHGTSTFG